MEIRKRMTSMSSTEISDELAQIIDVVRLWPKHVSRPPDRSWRKPDVRLRACLVIEEEVTYKPIIAALCAAFRLRSGHTAVKLRRRWVGPALDMDHNPIKVNEPGEADTSGRFIIEHPSGALLSIYLAVEMKMAGGSEDEDQKKERDRIMADGGIAIVVFGEADAIAKLSVEKNRIAKIWGCL